MAAGLCMMGEGREGREPACVWVNELWTGSHSQGAEALKQMSQESLLALWQDRGIQVPDSAGR